MFWQQKNNKLMVAWNKKWKKKGWIDFLIPTVVVEVLFWTLNIILKKKNKIGKFLSTHFLGAYCLIFFISKPFFPSTIFTSEKNLYSKSYLYVKYVSSGIEFNELKRSLNHLPPAQTLITGSNPDEFLTSNRWFSNWTGAIVVQRIY